MANSEFNKLTCEIEIIDPKGLKKARFLHVVSVNIKLSYKTLTDTAEVVFPYSGRWEIKDENGFQSLRILGNDDEVAVFEHGSSIKIYLGYDFDNKLVFEGFITGITPMAPFTLFCEDAAWKLKQNNLHFSKRKGVRLSQVIDDLLEGTGVELHEEVKANEIVFPAGLMASNVSTARFLHELKKSYGVLSFIRDGRLMIGRSFFDSNNSVYKSRLTGDYSPPLINIAQDVPIGKDQLELRNRNSKSIAIKAVSVLRTNDRLELTVVINPDKENEVLIINDKDTRRSQIEQSKIDKEINNVLEGRLIQTNRLQNETRHSYNLEQEELLKVAKNELFNYAKNGLSGRFTTFGDYNLLPAQSIFIIDPKNKDKEGEYLIQDVTKTFGESGFRQIVTVPTRINNLDSEK